MGVLRLLTEYELFGAAYRVNYNDLSRRLKAPHKYYLMDLLIGMAIHKKIYFTRCGEWVFITPRVSLKSLESKQ